MIHTSDGQIFDSEWDMLKSQIYNPKDAEPPQEDINKAFDNYPEPDTDANGMPLQASRKPTGALESEKGTQVAGDVLHLPMYPGIDIDRRIGMDQLKDTISKRNPGATPEQINRAFDGYFGGGAKIIPLKKSDSGEYQVAGDYVKPENPTQGAGEPLTTKPPVPQEDNTTQFEKVIGELTGRKLAPNQQDESIGYKLFRAKTEPAERYKLWPEKVIDFGADTLKHLYNSAVSGVTLPKDVVDGKVDLNSNEGIKRTLDLAPFAILGIRPLEIAAGTSLSAAERLALDSYAINGYKRVNRFLDGNEGWGIGPVDKAIAPVQVKLIDRLIENSPRISEDMVLYRGLSNRVGQSNLEPYWGLKEGDVIKFPSFTSTSTDLKTAAGFTYSSGGNKSGIVLDISIPKGAKALNVDKTRDIHWEREVILPRDSSFRVVAPIQHSPTAAAILRLEHIPNQ